MKNKNILNMKYCCMQGIYWILVAAAVAYVTPLLEAKGYSGFEIGMLNFIRYASVILFQAVVASFADRYSHRISLSHIAAVMTVIGTIVTLIFWKCDVGFFGAVWIYIIIGATVNCLSPLLDSFPVKYEQLGKIVSYTKARACGSFSWAIACVLIGTITDTYGANSILLVQALVGIFFLVNLLSLDSMKQDKQTSDNTNVDSSERTIHNNRFLLTYNRQYTIYLVGTFFVFVCYNMSAIFLVNVVERLDGNYTDYGIAHFVLAMSEIPTALLFLRFRKRIAVDKLMLCCAIFNALRTLLTALSPTIGLLIASQTLDMFGLGIFYAGALCFVTERMPKQDVVKALGLVNLASVGAGEAVSSILSGWIKEYVSVMSVMYVGAAAGFISVIVMYYMVVSKKEEKTLVLYQR